MGSFVEDVVAICSSLVRDSVQDLGGKSWCKWAAPSKSKWWWIVWSAHANYILDGLVELGLIQPINVLESSYWSRQKEQWGRKYGGCRRTLGKKVKVYRILHERQLQKLIEDPAALTATLLKGVVVQPSLGFDAAFEALEQAIRAAGNREPLVAEALRRLAKLLENKDA